MIQDMRTIFLEKFDENDTHLDLKIHVMERLIEIICHLDELNHPKNDDIY